MQYFLNILSSLKFCEKCRYSDEEGLKPEGAYILYHIYNNSKTVLPLKFSEQCIYIYLDDKGLNNFGTTSEKKEL